MHHRSYDQGEGVCVQGRVCIWGKEGLYPEEFVSRGKGALHPGWCLKVAEGICLQKGLDRHPAGTGKAGGMHPTGNAFLFMREYRATMGQAVIG